VLVDLEAAEVVVGVDVVVVVLEEHVPKEGWQPVPQYVEVEPQYPYWEQQFPNVEPWQVIVLEQVPSVLTVRDVVVVVPTVLAFRYQFAAGSPRHSPTVTDLYP
jgi:hypothetical protein